MLDKQTALAHFAQSRASFKQMLGKMSELEALTIPLEGIWTAKDLIGHLTAWENLLVEPLQSLAAGGSFEPCIVADHDAFNLFESGRRQSMTLDEVLAESEAVREKIIAAIESLTEGLCQQNFPAPWGGQATLTHLVDGLRWHEDLHTQCIKRWIEQSTRQKPEE